MLPFRTARGARFRCLADFTRSAVLNLNFHDAARATIPFHLSVRRDEALVVVNRCDRRGWRREIHLPMVFARQPVAVEVLFGAGRVSARVNGQDCGTYDALPRPDRGGRLYLRRGFPGLGGIAHVEIGGALVADSLLVDIGQGDGERIDGVHLTESLEVKLRGLGAGAVARGTLRIEGFDEVIPAALRPLSYLLRDGQREHALAAVVPGRVWAQGADRLTLHLAREDGKAAGSVTLDRAGLVQRIEALAAARRLESDDRAALQVIEHLHHSGLMPDLGPGAQAAVLAAADRFGLGAYLRGQAVDGAEDSEVAPAPPAAPDPGAAGRRVAEAFLGSMRAAPGTDAEVALKAAFAALPAAGPDRAALVDTLTEWACLNGHVETLMRLRRAFVPAPLPEVPAGDLWTTSVRLPLDYAEGRFDRVLEALQRLAPASPVWLGTPAIGWVMEQAAASAPDLDGALPVDWQRNEMIRVALDLIANRAEDYWERTPCLRLIRGTVAILRVADTLPLDTRDRAVWLAGRVYGLSPAFWQRVAEVQAQDGWVLPAELVPVQPGFAALRTLIEEGAAQTREGRAALSQAFDLFRTLGSVDLARFRRDLFGPTGVSDEDPAGPLAPLVAGLDPNESALRGLAFPGAGAEVDRATREAAQRGLTSAYRNVAQSQMRIEAELLRRSAAQLVAGARDPARAEALAGALPSLGGATGRFLGLILGMATAQVLLDRGRGNEAAILLDRLLAIAATLRDAESREALSRASAPRQALESLMAAHGGEARVRRLRARLEPMLAPPVPGPVEDRAADLRAEADPVQDTLLCLYTCLPNLDTRVRAIRETWLPRLAAMGVPALVFVGGGDGRREGDVVHLDAPDDYEGLPQKTLALVRWVHAHTGFAHLVKVDDDCFLDPEAWFGDLAHRVCDYYGRPLTRVRGQMDRAWHQAKSRSARGRMELDKSPEPSLYADGGSGYALSRRAMTELIAAADSPAGQELIHLSFMEDKLVGDLLARRNIWVEGTDYRVSVLRRTKAGGPLVAAWENGFLPFKDSGMKLAHLDGHEKMAEVLKGADGAIPRPSKVWPSYQPLRLGARSNTLDLISHAAKLARVNAAPVAVVACLRNEIAMLPRFFEHYRALGVTGFLMADNGSDDGSFEFLAEQPDVALFAVDTEYSQSRYGVAWQQALMANFRAGRWSLVADLDEFLFWNTDLAGDLRALVDSGDFAGADAARVFMLDMYPGGPLAEADFVAESPFAQAAFVDREPFLAVSGGRGPYTDAPTWTSALRHRLIPGARPELFVAQKIALLKYRPWMRLSAGLHFVSDVRLARRELLFAHFKYNAAFRANAQAEVARRQHFNDAEEYRKYLALISEGRDVIHAPGVSVRWDESETVRRICAGGRASE